MRLGEVIKNYRVTNGITQQKFADKCGVSKSYISLLENGKTSRSKIESVPSIDVVSSFARAMNLSVDELLSIVDPDQPVSLNPSSPPRDLSKYGLLPIKTKRIPLLGEVACGEPVFAAQDYESYVEVGTDIRADFALKAKGDSMVNARINDGDIVFVRSQPDVDDGQIAVVIIDDDATLKRVRRTNGLLMLMAENTAYPPLVYTEEQANTIRIIGLAIAFQGDVK